MITTPTTVPAGKAFFSTPEFTPPLTNATANGPAARKPRREEAQVEIRSTSDIVSARRHGRALALALGFDGPNVTVIATAISEVARNIVDHAEAGVVKMMTIHNGERTGLHVVARDEGPGIFDASRVADYGRTAQGEAGLGLPGVRALMDEFEIESTVGRGTTVRMTKWLN